MSLKLLKKALLKKPPRTRSRTDMSCSEASASQGPDEIAEPEAEVISKEVSETRSLGSDIYNQSCSSTDVTKRIILFLSFINIKS